MDFRLLIISLVVVIAVVGIAMLLLCVKVIFRKNGRFSSIHIGDSRAMRERGIHCATSQDREQRKQKKINLEDL